MNELTTSVWQRQGCSLVWDRDLLTPVLQRQGTLPLRQALLWLQQGFPDSPPHEGQTILIGGLQPCLDVLSAEEAATFVQTYLRPLFLRWQDAWPGRAMVLGLACNWNQWRVDADDYAHFEVQRGREIDLTHALWGGAAKDAQMIMTAPAQAADKAGPSGKPQPARVGGLYVRRSS